MTKSVFISSTSEDLRDYRREVGESIERMRLDAIEMEEWGSRPGGAVGASTDEVKRADLFVGILAHRYGYVPEGMTKSVTEQEYDAAVKHRIPRLMYIVDPNYTWPPERIEADATARQKLAQFKERINRKEVRNFFTTPEDLSRKVATDVAAELIRQSQRRRLSISLIAVGIIFAAVVIVALTRPDIFVRLGLAAPPPMPAGFNIAVAGFGLQQADSSIKSDPVADDVSDVFLTSIRQLPGIDNARGRGDLGVGSILSKDTQQRQTEAARIATQLRATIVIYGLVKDQGNGAIQIEPAFYLSPEFAATQPEFVGIEDFGKPFTMLKNWSGSGLLGDRIQTLEGALTGLAYFYNGKYAEAQKSFEDALKVGSNNSGGWEVLDIFAGNAAVRLGNYQDALKFNTDSLRTRPTYARGLMARGVSFFQLAGPSRLTKNHLMTQLFICLTIRIAFKTHRTSQKLSCSFSYPRFT